MGIELELNLADADGMPRMVNKAVLDRIASRDFQTELGQFNLEVNIVPHRLQGRVFDQLAEELRTTLGYADRQAAEDAAHIVMTGILPTLTEEDLVFANLTEADRYTLLNDQIMAARGEEIILDIEGVERLSRTSASIAPEAACTSLQLHLQVTPDRFADVWNAAQAISAVQTAMGANSPFLFGRELWQESRPPLFQQATDTRPPELRAQGVRPRTWFGEKWISGVHDLFEENLRYFPALLPICDEEDPLEVLAAGGTPLLGELMLHNGTVYRWNRPVYGVVDGVPHLRVENRVLPAGPTVADLLANAAFYFGLTRQLADEERPIWSQLPFAVAEDNFHAAARSGIEAAVYWPGAGEIQVTDLVRSTLLAKAHAGLEKYGVDGAQRERLLGIIEERCRTGRNGATWQTEAVWAAEHRRGLDRDAALHDMLLRYSTLQHLNQPVHTWPIA